MRIWKYPKLYKLLYHSLLTVTNDIFRIMDDIGKAGKKLF